jgi:hypothetical protein
MKLDFAINDEHLAATLSLSDGNVIVSNLPWPEGMELPPEVRDTLAITLLLEVLREALDHLNGRPQIERTRSPRLPAPATDVGLSRGSPGQQTPAGEHILDSND